MDEATTCSTTSSSAAAETASSPGWPPSSAFARAMTGHPDPPPGARHGHGTHRRPDLRGVRRGQRAVRDRGEADPRRRPLALGLRPRSQLAPERRGLEQERHPGDPDQPPVHGCRGLGSPAPRRGPGRRGRRCGGSQDQAPLERRGCVGPLPRCGPRTADQPGGVRGARARRAANGRTTIRKPRRTPRPYLLRGLLRCGLCDRRMQGSWNHDQAAMYESLGFALTYEPDNRRVLVEADLGGVRPVRVGGPTSPDCHQEWRVRPWRAT
jgi:hypothetical protein